MTVEVPHRVPKGSRLEVICYSHDPELDLKKDGYLEDLATAQGIGESHDQLAHGGEGEVRVEIALFTPKFDKLKDRLEDDNYWEQQRRFGDDYDNSVSQYLRGGPNE